MRLGGLGRDTWHPSFQRCGKRNVRDVVLLTSSRTEFLVGQALHRTTSQRDADPTMPSLGKQSQPMNSAFQSASFITTSQSPNLGSILLTWAFEQLKVAGNLTRLLNFQLGKPKK